MFKTSIYLTLFALFASSEMAVAAPDHTISVRLQPNQGFAVLSDTLRNDLRPEYFKLSAHIDSLTLSIAGKTIPFTVNVGKLTTVRPQYPAEQGALKIRYRLTHTPKKDEPHLHIANDGVYLMAADAWYPVLKNDFGSHALRVELPLGWHSLSEGYFEAVIAPELNHVEYWKTDYDSETIHLFAAPYQMNATEHAGVQLQTFFHATNAAQGPAYLARMQTLVDDYQQRYGPYPYSKFAVVSSLYPTGYGMASYTLLDARIIPYPFIIEQSLAHEFVHNWWGNAVYVDRERGNWCEGLTTYEADYRSQLSKGVLAARDYRWAALRDYQNLVNKENVIALKDFTHRYSPASRAIGYGKTMMFFHMLSNRIGALHFKRALQAVIEQRMHRLTSYSDLRTIFESESGQSLSQFFDQWVNRSDIPALTHQLNTHDNVTTLTMTQETRNPYTLDVVVRVTAKSGASIDKQIRMSEPKQSFILEGAIEHVHIDPDYELMRRLKEFENPATLSLFLGASERQFIALFEPSELLLKGLPKALKGYPGKNKKILWQNKSVDKASFYFVAHTKLNKELITDSDHVTVQGLAVIVRNENDVHRIDLSKNVLVLAQRINGFPSVVVIAPTSEALLNIVPRLRHYGKSSAISFSLKGKKQWSLLWR